MEIGLLWKVGSGENILINRDKWIPDRPSGRIISNLSKNNDMRVSELLLPPYSWDTKKLWSLFLPLKVDSIIKATLMGADR